MHTSRPYAEFNLCGTHSVRIYDHSRVYFGDYFRVSLEVRCEIPMPMKPENSVGENCKPPDVALYSRFLERMAVPSAEVEDVRLALIAEFRRNSLPYLAIPDFPAKLIARYRAQQTGVKQRYAVSSG